MLVGQASEFPALLLVAVAVESVGLENDLCRRHGSVVIRICSSRWKDRWLILIGLALQGVCHVFLIIVIQLYVTRAATGLRASAQTCLP